MNYQITKSETVINNQKQFIDQCFAAKQILSDINVSDTTWDYSKYNLFVLMSGSELFWNLYKDICFAARKYIGDCPLWMQSWMNFHKQDQVLGWHNHAWEFHGYISIDPKKSKTIFDKWEVQNEVGNIYIGPGYHQHKVEVLENYEDYRITIGVDFYRDPQSCLSNVLIPVC